MNASVLLYTWTNGSELLWNISDFKLLSDSKKDYKEDSETYPLSSADFDAEVEVTPTITNLTSFNSTIILTV